MTVPDLTIIAAMLRELAAKYEEGGHPNSAAKVRDQAAALDGMVIVPVEPSEIEADLDDLDIAISANEGRKYGGKGSPGVTTRMLKKYRDLLIAAAQEESK